MGVLTACQKRSRTPRPSSDGIRHCEGYYSSWIPISCAPVATPSQAPANTMCSCWVSLHHSIRCQLTPVALLGNDEPLHRISPMGPNSRPAAGSPTRVEQVLTRAHEHATGCINRTHSTRSSAVALLQPVGFRSSQDLPIMLIDS